MPTIFQGSHPILCGAVQLIGPSRMSRVWKTTFDSKLRFHMSSRIYLFTTSSSMIHSLVTKPKHPPVEPPVTSRQPVPITKPAPGDQIRDLTSRVDTLLLDQTTFKASNPKLPPTAMGRGGRYGFPTISCNFCKGNVLLRQ